MQPIKARSLTPGVKAWLANSQSARILHVFDSVCNLINENKVVLSIVTPQMGNGPFNLVVQNSVCFSDWIDVESRVSIFPNQLNIGDLSVQIVNAKTWNPSPDWETLRARRDLITGQVLRSSLARDLGLHRKNLPIQPYLLSSLSSVLAAGNYSSTREITAKVAGLGSGLTPAGDDFLMGAVYATWILHPPKVAGLLAQEIAKTAAPLTTSLSAAWLRAAGNGEAGSLWHAFFDALISADPLRVSTAWKNILAVGETSGADAMAGFTAVFALWREQAGLIHG